MHQPLAVDRIIFGWHWWHCPTTILQEYKKTKQPCERKRRKSLVTLWLVNVTNHNVTQVLPWAYLH